MNCIRLFSYGVSLFLVILAGFDTETETITRQDKTLIFSNTDPKLDRDVKEKLIETFFEVYPEMKRDFNPKAPDTISVKVDTSYGGVAYANDGEIVISSEWLHKKPNDTDVITHEAMHIVQNYPRNSGPGWLTEGIADYVRYEYGVDNAAAGWALPAYSKESSYTDSYRTTARFLVWLHNRYGNQIIHKLDSRMRNKTYANSTWSNLTGHSLEQLWDEYAANPDI